jgi:hypothetical protein
MRILFMTAEQARQAFDASSGEIYASLISESADQAGGRALRLIGRAHESGPEGWSLWGGLGARDGGLDGDGNAAEVDAGSLAADLGVHYRAPGDAWDVGLVVSYVDSETEAATRGSRATLDGWRVGAFGRIGTGGEGLSLAASAELQRLDGMVRRDIAFAGLSRQARAGVALDSIAVAGELRWGFALGGGWAAGPVGSILHASSDLDDFAEEGADALNLSSDGASDDVTRIGAGLFVAQRSARFSVDASIQYIGGQASFAGVGMTLDGAPAAPFTILSPRTGADAALVSLSARRDLGGGWSIGGQGSAIVRSDGSSVAGTIWVGIRF